MIAEYCLTCSKGNIRDKYEDNYLFFDNISEDEQDKKLISVSDKRSIIAVFDGIGGMSHGEIASRISAEILKKAVKERFPESPEDILFILKYINLELCKVMAEQNIKFGSTASILLLNENRYYLCNIGDSPAFLIRNNEITQLSFDHTEQNNIDQIDGNSSNMVKKSRLTQHLGIDEKEMIIEPFTTNGTVEKGDKFIICSDGLTGTVRLSEIKRIASKNSGAGQISAELLKEALKNGGEDNITVISAVIRG